MHFTHPCRFTPRSLCLVGLCTPTSSPASPIMPSPLSPPCSICECHTRASVDASTWTHPQSLQACRRARCVPCVTSCSSGSLCDRDISFVCLLTHMCVWWCKTVSQSRVFLATPSFLGMHTIHTFCPPVCVNANCEDTLSRTVGVQSGGNLWAVFYFLFLACGGASLEFNQAECFNHELLGAVNMLCCYGCAAVKWYGRVWSRISGIVGWARIVDAVVAISDENTIRRCFVMWMPGAHYPLSLK